MFTCALRVPWGRGCDGLAPERIWLLSPTAMNNNNLLWVSVFFDRNEGPALSWFDFPHALCSETDMTSVPLDHFLVAHRGYFKAIARSYFLEMESSLIGVMSIANVGHVLGAVTRERNPGGKWSF